MLNRLLNSIIGSFIGVFIGRSSYAFWIYKKHPDIYAHFSAPWYTDILLSAAVCGSIVILALIAKYFVRKK